MTEREQEGWLSLGAVPFQSSFTALFTPLRPVLQAQHLTLLLDLPTGFALRRMSREDAPQRAVIFSAARSAEYLADLWDTGPLLLSAETPDLSRAELLFEQALKERLRWQVPPSHLTPAERRILHQLAQGHSNKVIAKQLGITDKTVQNTLIRIFEKLAVTDRTEAALHYWSQTNNVKGDFPYVV